MKIEMKNISKSFGTNKVLEAIDLTINSGEVHALLGENGAGKSTLMNILTGLFPASGGEIEIDSEKKIFKNPQEAEEFGISFIHQEMNTWPDLTVLENLFLGREIKNKFGILDTKAMRKKANFAFEQLGVKIDLDKEIGNLSVGQQQMVEIAKSFLSDLKILIMDEPTRGVDVGAKREIYQLMNELAERGVPIIMISSDLPEILGVADRIAVMHEGEIAGILAKNEATQENVMQLATGGQ
ncbi:ATP-binding cassette domain-containing protein [Lactococcus lactis]|uniref:ATP-binding cassette domain-containing protein n=1 Tax=Lactococcus lactis TaxID=1358 RepID=UPI00289270E0|nr:ATP-binding cassette domain-containing protein [Lactococcus lactis]MDT2867206.1 ATP-binding cassette domain-containing protein [Lactococcus lactis]